VAQRHLPFAKRVRCQQKRKPPQGGFFMPVSCLFPAHGVQRLAGKEKPPRRAAQ
jgi:hypothetical protein